VPIVVAAIIGYLLGSIPTGLLVGRWTRGVDLREHGSQRTGATNALRTLGTGAAAIVFALDVAKGIAAVVAARLLFVDDPLGEWAAAIAGLAAIVGHNWSIFMRFAGGRGVATFSGALAAMSPWTILVLAPVVALIVWRTRYVSLASIVGAVAAPGVTALFAAAGLAGLAAIAFAAAAATLVVGAHADNISRLRAGTERRIGHG
jgi:acyl phosphate:glycerol-3-phosphate acyltransferase